MLVQLLALAPVACIENQFALPNILQQPYFDVEKVSYPIDPEQFIETITLQYNDTPIVCGLPNSTAHEALLPASGEDVALAQEQLTKYESMAEIWSDDVWGWSLRLNSSLVQFLPLESSDGEYFAFSGSNFYTCTGVYLGFNPQPVTLGDRRAMTVKYANGSTCEAARCRRQTDLFFVCDTKAEPLKPRLQSVTEPHSCSYEMVIGINELCDIPAFHTKPETNSIVCGPAPHATWEFFDYDEVPYRGFPDRKFTDQGLYH